MRALNLTWVQQGKLQQLVPLLWYQCAIQISRCHTSRNWTPCWTSINWWCMGSWRVVPCHRGRLQPLHHVTLFRGPKEHLKCTRISNRPLGNKCQVACRPSLTWADDHINMTQTLLASWLWGSNILKVMRQRALVWVEVFLPFGIHWITASVLGWSWSKFNQICNQGKTI